MRDERIVSWTILALSAILVVVQLSSLYTSPVPDSYLWWGDEHQQMLEARSMIAEGVNRDPHALGSSIADHNGLVRGNVWVTAMLYGSAQVVFQTFASPVAIGRTVTAFLAVFLLSLVYYSIRRLGAGEISAAIGVLLLVSSRSFFFTSHSARYDILTSLALLAIVCYASLKYQKLREGRWQVTPAWAFVCGALAVLAAMVSSHMLTLLLLFEIYASYKLGILKSLRNTSALLFGVIAGALLFIGAFYLSTGDISLLATHGQQSTFVNVVEERPILRLFSRSVQWANLVQRSLQIWELARWVVILLMVGIGLTFTLRHRLPSHAASFFAISTIALLLCWLLNESSGPTSYLIYALPGVCVLAAVLIDEPLKSITSRFETVKFLVPSVVALALFAFGFSDARTAKAVGDELVHNNEEVLRTVMKQIDTSNHPVVLGYNPAANWLISRTDIFGMSTHFFEMPASANDVGGVLRANNVRYAVTYANSWKHDYMREVEPIETALKSVGVLRFEQVGAFTDVGRSYFSKSVQVLDTLRFYQCSTEK